MQPTSSAISSPVNGESELEDVHLPSSTYINLFATASSDITALTSISSSTFNSSRWQMLYDFAHSDEQKFPSLFRQFQNEPANPRKRKREISSSSSQPLKKRILLNQTKAAEKTECFDIQDKIAKVVSKLSRKTMPKTMKDISSRLQSDDTNKPLLQALQNINNHLQKVYPKKNKNRLILNYQNWKNLLSELNCTEDPTSPTFYEFFKIANKRNCDPYTSALYEINVSLFHLIYDKSILQTNVLRIKNCSIPLLLSPSNFSKFLDTIRPCTY